MSSSSVTLKNDGAEATILADRGALLSSLILAPQGGRPVELLYASPDFKRAESGWPGGGVPVMFPFAGRVFHQGMPFQYTCGAAVLNMPLHGFAYGLPWKAEQTNAASVRLELQGSAKTYELFPYDFRLSLEYTLASPRELRVRMTAENLGVRAEAAQHGTPAEMPVAFGLHPYFKMPFGTELAADLDNDAFELETSAREQIAVTPAGGAGKASPYPGLGEEHGPKGGVPLVKPLLRNLILAGHGKSEASLVHPKLAWKLKLGFGPADVFRYVVLWAPEGAPFYCLEPWMGLPDAVATGAGLKQLGKGETVSGSVTISLD